MKNIDVLLINLPTTCWYKEKFAQSNSMPPLGLLYIGTVLKENGFKVQILDFAVESFTKESFKNKLLELSPKIVGMSTYNESWKAQKVLCKIIKNELPDTKIWAGGAFSTFCYEDILNKTETDYITKGEGELSSLMLCNKFVKKMDINIDDIPGIIYKKVDGTFYINNNFKRICNLDELPFPDRSMIDFNKYLLPYTINTSRGCPGQCIFCSSKAFWGKNVYMRSAENVFAELMDLYNKYKTNIFYITDDTFTASAKRVMDFCKLIKASKIKFLWGCESRADVITDELMKTLYDAGCRKLQIGLESADNDILKKLKKNVTIEQIERGIRLAYENKMHISASFIIGHAFDTEETIDKTLKFVKHIQKDYGAFVMGSSNTPFPGTEQYEMRDKLGIKIHAKEWDEFVLNLPTISTKNISIDKLRYYFNVVTKIMESNNLDFELREVQEV
ncbi:B12-binding domain-containing radical SAM protein [Clostridium perfringens]|uniref:B12-binding domain-containing radical SAM protein n=1 Tax=Clostridium perfringens TaxID=1502 RepID=UPI0024BBF04F|nr:radical SAM protein [Clostridium perfringens]ELC8463946.1 B12-binding domain-containing radical SAM protein [Clostridium perfringens]